MKRESTKPRLGYTVSTYHRRSVHNLAERHRRLVRGRSLNIGGRNDHWLLCGVQAVGLELEAGPGVDVVGDARALPFADESFDTVLATEVIEHVRQPNDMVSEIHRVLKPGGHAILSSPFVWKLHRWPQDYWRFTDDSFALLFKNFAECQVFPVNGTHETFMHVLWQYAEIWCEAARVPRRALLALKPIEWLSWLLSSLVSLEQRSERAYTTGWFVVARK
jgi:SAM-dependent methyltransferase